MFFYSDFFYVFTQGGIMKKEENQEKMLLLYEQPDLEVIEFSLEESIATSGDFGYSTICGEQQY